MLAREDLFAAPHHPTAALRDCRAAHLLPVGWLPRDNFPTQGRGPASQLCAARSSVGAKRAV